jgi:hypothetical protein
VTVDFLTLRRELGRDARVAEAHRAAIGGLGLGLPQWREHGRDARVAEAHRAAIGDFAPGLPQRRERGCTTADYPRSRIHLVSPSIERWAKLPALTKAKFSDDARTDREKILFSS